MAARDAAAPRPSQAPMCRLLLALTLCIACYFIGTLRTSQPKCPEHSTALRLESVPTSAAPATASTPTPTPTFPPASSLFTTDKPWCQGPTAHSQQPFHFPKLIHQTVKDKRNISCEVMHSMASWRDLNPGYEHRLYDDQDCAAFVKMHYPEILPLYQNLRSPVERADLWRYLVLHRHGGVYADVDVQCMRPVAEWNAHNGHDAGLLVPVVFLEGPGHVKQCSNFVMAAAPCHPVMARVAVRIVTGIAVSALQGEPVSGEAGIVARTGPGALTAALAEYAGAHSVPWPVDGKRGAVEGKGNLVASARLMPISLMAMGWSTAQDKISCSQALEKSPQSYICHQYFGSWKTVYSFKPKLTFGPDCRYWGLQPTSALNLTATAQ